MTLDVASLTSKPLTEARIRILTAAADEGIAEADLKRLAEAARVSTKTAGITLPAGRYENLSRGRGWCRKGRGDTAQWAERVEGGYFVAESGRWIVGCSDGFSRKDQTEWDVSKIGRFWIAN